MMFPNWAKNIIFLLIYMISGLILVILIEGLSSGSDLTPLNNVVEQLVVHVRTPLLTTLMVWVTRMGSPFIVTCAALFIAVMLAVRGYAYEATLFVVAIIITGLSLTVLKNVFQVVRPISDIYQTDGWSFPSGHATMATAFFFMLGYAFWGKLKTLRARTTLVVGSVFGIFLVCFSRIYLGAHWMLDIIGALAVGMLSVSFTILIFNIFLERNRSLRNRLNL